MKIKSALPILQAVLVTILWSSSWVLIRFGLDDMPPVTFAGLRYFTAFVVLLAVWLWRGGWHKLGDLTRRDWLWLLAFGVVAYTITQALAFVALSMIPAIMYSLLLNFSAVLVALLGWLFLSERLNGVQWVGISIFLVGVGLYFWPLDIPAGLWLGLLVAIISLVATSGATVMGRFINQLPQLEPLTVTVVSMGFGSVLMLVAGVLLEPWPALSWGNLGNIAWLAVVNTAFAFTLWNHTQRSLTAMQSNIINNTMLVQIALLAWAFLGETPTARQWLGMGVVLVGVVLVNWRPKAAIS